MGHKVHGSNGRILIESLHSDEQLTPVSPKLGGPVQRRGIRNVNRADYTGDQVESAQPSRFGRTSDRIVGAVADVEVLRVTPNVHRSTEDRLKNDTIDRRT